MEKALKYERPFRFRQFEVYQDRCAMKVGTDAVLLGAWAPAENARRVLDIGTGTGLLALMLAQRNDSAHIEALEIEPEAAAQAAENFTCSPWATRLSAICTDFAAYVPSEPYDHIVCNPPYFSNALLPPGESRSLARHEVNFSFGCFFEKAAQWLTQEGKISLVFPAETVKAVLEPAVTQGVNLERCTRVYTGSRRQLSRVLLTFGRSGKALCETELYLHDAEGKASETYRRFTSAFYLNDTVR